MLFIFFSYIKKLLENFFNKRVNIMFMICIVLKDVFSKIFVVFWMLVFFWSSYYYFLFCLIFDFDIILICLGKKFVNIFDIFYNSIDLKNILSSNWKINMIVMRNLY